MSGEAEQHGRYRVTNGGWMCVDCGALVDYLDGRDVHNAWHVKLNRALTAIVAIAALDEGRG